jgi:hypothetical protein
MSSVRGGLRALLIQFISKNYSAFISLRWISGRAGAAS